jgi:hypothetical protein
MLFPGTADAIRSYPLVFLRSNDVDKKTNISMSLSSGFSISTILKHVLEDPDSALMHLRVYLVFFHMSKPERSFSLYYNYSTTPSSSRSLFCLLVKERQMSTTISYKYATLKRAP